MNNIKKLFRQMYDNIFGGYTRPSPFAGMTPCFYRTVDVSDYPVFTGGVFKVRDEGNNIYKMTYETKKGNESVMAEVKGWTFAAYLTHMKENLDILRDLAKSIKEPELAYRADKFIKNLEKASNHDYHKEED